MPSFVGDRHIYIYICNTKCSLYLWGQGTDFQVKSDKVKSTYKLYSQFSMPTENVVNGDSKVDVVISPVFMTKSKLV